MIFGKSYNNIELDDIENLIKNQIQETKTLDYKREIKLNSDSEKKEFLNDVASFANTDGGILIYGVTEKKDENGQNTGFPEEICGIGEINFDKLKQKIELLILNSIEPNIPNIIIKQFIFGEKNILFLGINKMNGLPRMVTFNHSNKFYKRNNSGKYLVDIYELNQLFMENIELTKELDNFRLERLENIKNKTSDKENSNSLVIVHIIPVNYFRQKHLSFIDHKILEDIREIGLLGNSNGLNYRHNLDGYLIITKNQNKITSYSQIFRNGIIELLTSQFSNINEGKEYLYLPWMEKKILNQVKKILNFYKNWEISPPFSIYISILNTLNKTIYSVNPYYTKTFTDKDLLIPDILINNFDENIDKVLKDAFDIIWQSVDIRESPSFNSNGNLRENNS